MRAESLYIDKIDAAIMASYSASTEDQNYAMLSENLALWDDEEYIEKGNDETRIAEELHKLITYLDKKGLKRQSDEIFRIMLLTFPERHFAQSPTQAHVEGIDFALFKPGSENMQKFEDCYRMALADLQRFSHDIEMRLFREGCIGLAGELFTTFSVVAIESADSEHHAIPWKLMHQLAWHLNKAVKDYNQAYGILRSILSLKTAAPPGELVAELENSMFFFKRNHYWQRIDEAIMTGDNTTLVMYIDRLMPMVTASHEKSDLIVLRSKAVKEKMGLPWGCLLTILASIAAILTANYLFDIFTTDPTKQAKIAPLNTSTLQTPESGATRSLNSTQEPASMSLQVLNRAGLDETKPPLQPIGRKLSLSEIRYVIFQKHRLEHLEEVELSPQEEEMLHKLWQEWQSRGNNAEFDREEQQKVELEAELYSDQIKDDAEDLLELIAKSLEADDWKKEDNKDNSFDKNDEKPDSNIAMSEKITELLNLRTPADIRKVLLQLEKTGYYNGPTDLIHWNKVARAALARFKAAKMLRTDNKWDLETQQALFANSESAR